MGRKHDYDDNHSFDLLLGLLLGLLGGAIVGILFAPKPGKETQKDVQDFVNRLPDELSRSKGHYKELVGKTKDGIETQMEKRNQRKQALRMADAKRREEMEAGSYEY